MTSVYQKIHAFALKAQTRHRLQLKGLHHTAANLAEICKTDCNQQFRWREVNNLDIQEPLIVPRNLLERNSVTCTLDLNDNMNPIDQAISSLKYSSIPYFLFENHSEQHSRKCVMRSEDGWFDENIWTTPTTSSQALEMDSDTDSLSSSTPSTELDSEAEYWFRMIEEVVRVDGDRPSEEGLDDKLSRLHGNGLEVQQLPKDSTVSQSVVPLKGMARLRRISPISIKTATLQETSKHVPSRANVIQRDLKEPNKAQVGFTWLIT